MNGAFAAGSLPFNAQAAQEALTGRPAPRRRWTNHFAYASYTGGSAVYLAQSMASGGVVPIIAGALFTGGTIMLWPGDVKPRPRPVDPASPQSAKPWLPSRLALGGGFGVGLLLFSGMTLAGEPWKSDDGDGSAAPGVGGSDPGNAPGTEPPPPVRPEPPEQPEEERPLMLIVLPADGLRLRESPAADAPVQAVFLHGTFVEDLGRRQTDKAGDTWVAVCGRTADQRELEGWVMARYVEAHSSGAMSGLGRINPALEEQGYVWVPVQLGDTMSGIVQDEASNFAVAAMLNDHIIDPDHLYVGDRIYLPG